MASPIQLKNNAVGRLTSGVSSSATTLILVSGDGAKFPTLTGAQYFPATLIRASDSAVEIVKVTARSGDVLTVVRAQEGTTGLALLAGDRIELRMTAQTLLDQVTYTISSFGVGNTDTVAWTSPDDWTKATGTYIVTAANFPTHPFPGDSTDCVVMHSRSTSTANQIAFIADSGVSVVRVATRRWGGGSGGSWSTWREVYHTGNLGVASETAAGIVELATAGEVQAGTDATRAVTPAGLASRTATETRAGIVELATAGEVQEGTDTVRAVTPAGLASRTATETRAGLVELATAAEAQALASATLALTPARLADAFKGANQSLSDNGYQKLPGGLIIQWGSIAVTSGQTIVFPVAFQNNLRVSVVPGFGAGLTQVFYSTQGTPPWTGFILNHSAGGPVTFNWIAIGY